MKLSATNLSIGYGKDKILLNNLSFTLQESSLTCLIGRNGIGKSTLMRTIVGTQKPISGNIYIDDTNTAEINRLQIAKKISLVLTDKIPEHLLTIEDLVSIGRLPYTGFSGRLSNDDKQIVKSSLKLLKIENIKNSKLHQVSDGQRQRALIAKALAQQTPIMLLDEPTAFLDFQSRLEIMQLLSQVAQQQNVSILMTTHEIEIARKFADKIWVIENDQLIECTKNNYDSVLPHI